MSQASLLSGRIAAHYENEQLLERQIQEELWQERLAEANDKKIRAQERKRDLLDKLVGVEVYFLADYLNNLRMPARKRYGQRVLRLRA